MNAPFEAPTGSTTRRHRWRRYPDRCSTSPWNQGFGFLPLKGEQDKQYEVGIAIPSSRVGRRALTTSVQTRENFFDHDVVGNSNIFLPLTIDTAERIRRWEATIRCHGENGLQAHLAYSHQFVEGRGAITGGLTEFSPPSDDYFFLDHNQRDTLTGGVNVEFPHEAWPSGSIEYGSGFLEGDGPEHKPAHMVVSLQGDKAFGRQWSRDVGLQRRGERVLLDESNTFGGTHFNLPRQISAGMGYRFRY